MWEKRDLMEKEVISIYTIAKEAEVSPATVSRVLTGNARVSDEKKPGFRKRLESMILDLMHWLEDLLTLKQK